MSLMLVQVVRLSTGVRVPDRWCLSVAFSFPCTPPRPADFTCDLAIVTPFYKSILEYIQWAGYVA